MNNISGLPISLGDIIGGVFRLIGDIISGRVPSFGGEEEDRSDAV